MGNEGECPMQHSALGWRYRMAFYQSNWRIANLVQSMSWRESCLMWQWKVSSEHLKCFHTCWYASVDELESALHKYIRYYNHGGIKLKSQELSSVQYRLQSSKVAWLNCPTSWSQFNESSSIFRFPSNNVLDRKNSPYRVKWCGIYYCSKTR